MYITNSATIAFQMVFITVRTRTGKMIQVTEPRNNADLYDKVAAALGGPHTLYSEGHVLPPDGDDISHLYTLALIHAIPVRKPDLGGRYKQSKKSRSRSRKGRSRSRKGRSRSRKGRSRSRKGRSRSKSRR